MTTIVFDGKILATDSRGTLSSTSSASSYKCAKCDEHSNRCKDDKIKIAINFKSKFKGETILAVGITGDGSNGDKFIDFLKIGEDIEEIMPEIYKSPYGWTCACKKYFATAHTRAITFRDWQIQSRGK